MSKEFNDRVLFCVRGWGITIERTTNTRTSLIVHGKRGATPIVLKVVKERGDEWRCGEIAAKFGGRGVVQVYEHMAGAALFEKLDPGEPLAALTLAGRDDEATDVLAMMLGRMAPGEPPEGCATVEQWGGGFVRGAALDDGRIPSTLLDPAQRIYSDLAATQREPALLHGDLHHYNVLSDRSRGWCAIDPNGVVGELEYELGAVLRNPIDRPDLYATLPIVERRLEQFGLVLGLDVSRARGWCFAQAVLAAIHAIEDGDSAEADSVLTLAHALLESSALRSDFID